MVLCYLLYVVHGNSPDTILHHLLHLVLKPPGLRGDEEAVDIDNMVCLFLHLLEAGRSFSHIVSKTWNIVNRTR